MLLPLVLCARISLANNLSASIELPLEARVFTKIAFPDALIVLPLVDSKVMFSDRPRQEANRPGGVINFLRGVGLSPRRSAAGAELKPKGQR